MGRLPIFSHRNVWEGTTDLFASYSQTNDLNIKVALFRERIQVTRSFQEVESQLHKVVKLTPWWEDSLFSPIEMYGMEPLIDLHGTAKPMS